MKKFLLGLVVLIAGLGALTTALLTDANLKNFTERWLSAQLGRAIVVDGEFSAELGIPLRLTATSVRVANPDWVGTPDMATAAFIEAAIDPRTIPGDAPLMLEELIIKQLKGGLVSDDQGRANWDFTDDDAPDVLIKMLDGQRPNLVLSDMAPNTVGHPKTDHLRTMALVEMAWDFALNTLEDGGAFITKVFQGGTGSELMAAMKPHFKTIKHIKPKSSRKESPETYLVATGFKA